MLTHDEQTTILTLLEAGMSVQDVAARSGRSVATIYTLKKVGQSSFKPIITNYISPKIMSVKDFIDHEVRKGAKNSVRLYREVQKEGYKGSYSLLNTYVKNQALLGKPYKRSMQVITDPGEQAQADWGSFGKITIGDRVERLYGFVYTLSYSRAIYVEFVVRQNQQTFQACHIHAFEKLGIPRNIRYDNIKTVVLNRERLPDRSTKDYLNPAFLDFARYYGFNIQLSPRYWPRDKGKVEAGVGYVKGNFMERRVFGKAFKTLEELNEQAKNWTDNVAQQRIHGTVEEKPFDRWLKEKKFLEFPINLPHYTSSPFQVRRSTKDGILQYKSSIYSVPSQFAQKKLYVREMPKHGQAYLEIYYKNSLIATHKISSEKGKWNIDESHVLDRTIQGLIHTSGNKRKRSRRPDIKVARRGLGYYNSLIPKKGLDNG